MNTAEKIANWFGNDGQCFNNNGLEIGQLCELCGGDCTKGPSGSDTSRFDFDDGSAIVFWSSCWDFSCDDCEGFCMQGAGCECECDDD